jgi:hypothetical protein
MATEYLIPSAARDLAWMEFDDRREDPSLRSG